jgi:hypothetical protein
MRLIYMTSTIVPSSLRSTPTPSSDNPAEKSTASRPLGSISQKKTRNSGGPNVTFGLPTEVSKFVGKLKTQGKNITNSVVNIPKEIDNGFHRLLNYRRWSEGLRSDKEERSKGQTPLSDDLSRFGKYSPGGFKPEVQQH